MTDEIIQVQAGFLAPVVTVQDALNAYQAKKDLIDRIMKKDVDYGVVPGSSKPTLLKAGSEKATSFFGLHPVIVDAEVINDWTGEQHGGEPFFFYRRTCNLYHGDVLVASVDGSCNSWEKKYRYRSSDRVCPQCGKPTIIKGKAEYGGGWICFSKKGGCGAKFADDDPKILDQPVGQIKNPDVADLANTILKMADKRALVAATLIATGLSEYFTQDIDDFVDATSHDVVEVGVTDEAWSEWEKLKARAKAMKIKYPTEPRAQFTLQSLRKQYGELLQFVKDAEEQAAAEQPA